MRYTYAHLKERVVQRGELVHGEREVLRGRQNGGDEAVEVDQGAALAVEGAAAFGRSEHLLLDAPEKLSGKHGGQDEERGERQETIDRLFDSRY